MHPVERRLEHRAALLLYRGQERVECRRELSDPVVEEVGGQVVDRDARTLERGQNLSGVVHVLFEVACPLPMVAESVERGRWNRVDRVGADERFDV